MAFQKQILFLSLVIFFTIFSMAESHSEQIVSSASDSLKANTFTQNQIALSDSIVNYGKLFLNTPYHYGSPGTSTFDCSGFTSYVFRNFGYDLQRSSFDQSKQFDTVERSDLKAGDLVFFSGRRRSKRVGHVGIVISAKGNGEFKFIHAAVHTGVTISNSTEEYYTKRFLKASRVLAANPLLSVVHRLFSTKKPVDEPDKLTQIAIQTKTQSVTPVQSTVKQTKRIIPAEYHRVKSGETLSAIARKYGMTTSELKRKNNIKGNKLSIKQHLKVKDEETILVSETVQTPINKSNGLSDNKLTISKADNSKSDKFVSTTQGNVKIYTVKKGETLFSISKLYNITIDDLKKINGISTGKIHIGQELKLSQPVTEAKSVAVTNVESPQMATSHKVISGESLFSISKMYNIPVDQLMKINNITNKKIRPGQEIKLNQVADSKITNEDVDKPSNKIVNTEKSITHKIKKGESLISIAKDNNISVDELKRINNLPNNKIRFGQELKLNQISEKHQTITSNTERTPERIQHKVKSGESYYSIAKKYGCTIDDLKEWNKKTGSKIKPGEKIIVYPKVGKLIRNV